MTSDPREPVASGGLGGRWRAWIASYVQWSTRRARTVLGVCLLVSIAAGLASMALRVNPRVEALLPAEAPSIEALNELKRRLPDGTTPLYLLVSSPDIELSRRLAKQLHERVLTWEETRWSMYKREPGAFLNKRLLFLSPEDLEDLNDQISERVRWEECEKLPGCANLDDEAPELPTEADLQAMFEKNPDVRALVSLFGNETKAFASAPSAPSETAPSDTAPSKTAPSKTAPSDKATETPATEAGGEIGELCDQERGVCAVQVALYGDADNLEFATQIYERSERLFDEVRPEGAPAQLRMAVSGQFRDLPLTKRAITEDLGKTTLISLSLILGLVLLQFRGLRGPLMLIGTALIGILWTAGGLGLVHPELNLISAFTLAVLAGVGLDFGVHLLTHYCREREAGVPAAVAMTDTLQGLMPSLLVAAFTTACGFGALYAASFRGFSEMGPIAAAGVVVSLLAFLLLLPPLVALLDNDAASPSLALRRYKVNPWPFIKARATLITSLGIVLTIGGGWIGKDVGFEYNFRKLRAEGGGHGIDWASSMHGTTRSSVYMLADDSEHLQEAAKQLRASRPTELLNTDGPFLVIPSAFIPAQQEARLAAIGQLKDTLANARERADGALQERIDALEPLVNVTQPLAVEELPRWMRDWLIEKDGRFGTLGVLYTDLSGANARHMELLARHMHEWRQRFPQVRFASSVALLGEVTPQLRAEAPTILGLALLGIIVATLVAGRSLRRTLVVMLPLVMMIGVGLGIMVWLDWHINLYNMLVFPLAFGVGVDGAVYVAWAMTGAGSGERLMSAARAVLGSTLTTMAGFGALMVSTNPGLASIGQLSVLLLGLALLANLLWLPCLMWVGRRSRPNTIA